MMPVFYEIYLKIAETDCIFSLFPIFDMRQDRMMTIRDELGLDMKKFSLTESEFNELGKSSVRLLVKNEVLDGDHEGGGRYYEKGDHHRGKNQGHDSYSQNDHSGNDGQGAKKKKTDNRDRMDQSELHGRQQKSSKTGNNRDSGHPTDRKNPQGQPAKAGGSTFDDFAQGGGTKELLDEKIYYVRKPHNDRDFDQSRFNTDDFDEPPKRSNQGRDRKDPPPQNQPRKKKNSDEEFLNEPKRSTQRHDNHRDHSNSQPAKDNKHKRTDQYDDRLPPQNEKRQNKRRNAQISS